VRGASSISTSSKTIPGLFQELSLSPSGAASSSLASASVPPTTLSSSPSRQSTSPNFSSLLNYDKPLPSLPPGFSGDYNKPLPLPPTPRSSRTNSPASTVSSSPSTPPVLTAPSSSPVLAGTHCELYLHLHASRLLPLPVPHARISRPASHAAPSDHQPPGAPPEQRIVPMSRSAVLDSRDVRLRTPITVYADPNFTLASPPKPQPPPVPEKPRSKKQMFINQSASQPAAKPAAEVRT
jgi:hypothetical protein